MPHKAIQVEYYEIVPENIDAIIRRLSKIYDAPSFQVRYENGRQYYELKYTRSHFVVFDPEQDRRTIVFLFNTFIVVPSDFLGDTSHTGTFLLFSDDEGALIVTQLEGGDLVEETFVFIDAPLATVMTMSASDVVNFAEGSGNDPDSVTALRVLMQPFGGAKLGDIVLACPKCGSTDLIYAPQRGSLWECNNCETPHLTPVTYNQYHATKEE